MKKYLFLFTAISAFLFLLISGCGGSSDEEISITSFPKTLSLKGATVKIPVDILMPSRVFAVNDKFVVYDHNSKSAPFKVFSIPTLEHIYTYGVRGQGPGEFGSVNTNSLRSSLEGLEVLDGQTFKLFEVTDDSLKQVYTAAFPQIGGPTNGLQRMNDTIFFLDNMLNESQTYEHFIFNLNREKVVGEFGEFPDDGLKFDKHYVKYQVYNKAGVARPDRSRFATFYYNFNRFKIYDSQGKLIKKVSLDMGNNTAFDLTKKSSNPIYNAEPVATEKYIYVLGVDRSKKEVEESVETFRPHVKVWDWDGNPIADLQLDKPIITFAVSETDKGLYGMSFLESNEIYKFDISELLNTGPIPATSSISSSIYDAQIFEGWKNAEPDKAIDAWISSRSGALIMNKNIYVSNDKDRCGSSIWFTVRKSSTNDLNWAKNYLENYSMKGADMIDYNTFYDTILNRPTRVFRYKFEATEPSGKKYFSKGAEWLWIENNEVLEVKFFSCENYERLYQEVEKIVASVKLKNTL